MDAEIPDATIRRMVDLVEPEWELRGTTPVEGGSCAVYRLVLEAGSSTRECFLEASPDGEWGVPADARVSTLLRARTSIPVPPVIGVVDDHPSVPSPFYVADAMPGSDVPYEAVGRVPDDVLRTTARQLGRHLGELHRVEAVESFGYVDYDESRPLSGGRPAGSAADLAVAGGTDSWEASLRARIDHELERHAASRFDALTPRIESWSLDRLDRLSDSSTRFAPVLGRNDHGYHNLLIDPDTGEITAMLDWAYTLAVTPAYDFEFGAYLFGGSFLSALPGVRDRRGLVRTAMLAGYRSTAPRLAEAVSTPRPLYELLAAVRIMNDFDQPAPRLPEGTEDAVADGVRRGVETLLDGDR